MAGILNKLRIPHQMDAVENGPLPLAISHSTYYTLDMTVTLPDELARELDQRGNVPLPAVHPSTGKTFFLISEEQYERLKPLFEEDPLSLDEQRFQLQQMGKRAEWNDSAMDAYDHYDEHRAQG